MIQYVSMTTDDKSTGAILFQLAWYRDVHSSVSKYLGASIMLV